MFSLSLHELTACVYYKLAIERGLRGCNPDSEEVAHQTTCAFQSTATGGSGFVESDVDPVLTNDNSKRSKSENASIHSESTAAGAGAGAGGAAYDCKKAENEDIAQAIR